METGFPGCLIRTLSDNYWATFIFSAVQCNALRRANYAKELKVLHETKRGIAPRCRPGSVTLMTWQQRQWEAQCAYPWPKGFPHPLSPLSQHACQGMESGVDSSYIRYWGGRNPAYPLLTNSRTTGPVTPSPRSGVMNSASASSIMCSTMATFC
jgi:hypothetical protein